MKKGDKVVLRKYEDSDGFTWWGGSDWIGKEVVVISVDNEDNTFAFNNGIWWLQSACEPVELPKEETKEYFYVGQTVYSPLFHNNERKAIITKIDKEAVYPILCEAEEVFMLFTFDGKYHEKDDYSSLFQEPIQFPVNKPIERFEEGEIVEVSNNGEFWKLCRFIGYSENNELPYRVYTVKDDKELQHSIENYAKIRKVK